MTNRLCLIDTEGSLTRAIGIAVAIARSQTDIWIIRKAAEEEFCIMLGACHVGGPTPACEHQIVLLSGDDGFTGPVCRVNLGPGVWPTGE